MFDIVVSVMIVLAVLLGGRGTLWGPILGAFILEPLNEITNNEIGGGNQRLIIFGGLLVAVVLLLPQGIIPSVGELVARRRSRGTASPVGARFERPLAVARATPIRRRPSGTGRALLEVEGVDKRFGGLRALDGCSLTVEEGTITALIGPNGSGKTTLFNVIDGTMPRRPRRGPLRRAGASTGCSPWERAHRGIGRTFQITRLFREMTVLENVVAPLRSFSWRRLGADAVSGPEAERAA